MHPSVLLLHTLPDGSSHYDWMIRRPDGSALITFRVPERIDRISAGEFRAQRLADHRTEYLTYEGEVSGGRGRVDRVAVGEFDLLEIEAERLVARGRLGQARGSFDGDLAAAPWWTFRFTPDAPGK